MTPCPAGHWFASARNGGRRDPGTNRALGRAQGKLTPAVHDGRGEYVTAIQNRHETKEARSEVMGELTQEPGCRRQKPVQHEAARLRDGRLQLLSLA